MNVHDLRSPIDQRDESATTAMLREIFQSSPTAAWAHIVHNLSEITRESEDTRAFVTRCVRPIFPEILMRHLSQMLISIAQGPRSGDAQSELRGKA